GLGWSDEEYAASGATKQHVGRRSEEFIQVVRTLWTSPVAEFEGRFYRIPPTSFEPKPASAPPILLGGTVPAALKRAGPLADGWVSSSRADLVHIGDSVATVKAAARDAGRDPESLRFVTRGPVRVRANGERRPLTGTLEEIRSDFDDLAAQGITEVFVDLNF